MNLTHREPIRGLLERFQFRQTSPPHNFGIYRDLETWSRRDRYGTEAQLQMFIQDGEDGWELSVSRDADDKGSEWARYLESSAIASAKKWDAEMFRDLFDKIDAVFEGREHDPALFMAMARLQSEGVKQDG